MRALRLFAAIGVSAVLAGCASAKTQASNAPAAPAAAASPSTTSPSITSPGTTSPSTTSPGPAASPAASTAGPSASALMVCGPEIAKDVATVLALPAAPATTATWTDHLYTCTYHLPSGTLVLSVKESPDTTSATGYFSALRRQLGTATALTGAQGLGNAGYETSTGNVVILKDDKTLRVDATGLPAASGTAQLTRTDLAYEIATDIIGCWNGS